MRFRERPCEHVETDHLVGVDERLPRSQARHIETCLQCQEEQAEYERLISSLKGLRDSPGPLVASDVVDDALAYVFAGAEEIAQISKRRMQTVARVSVVATVAGVAIGAAVILGREKGVAPKLAAELARGVESARRALSASA